MAGYGIVVTSFGAAIGPRGPVRWGALKNTNNEKSHFSDKYKKKAKFLSKKKKKNYIFIKKNLLKFSIGIFTPKKKSDYQNFDFRKNNNIISFLRLKIRGRNFRLNFFIFQIDLWEHENGIRIGISSQTKNLPIKILMLFSCSHRSIWFVQKFNFDLPRKLPFGNFFFFFLFIILWFFSF